MHIKNRVVSNIFFVVYVLIFIAYGLVVI